KPTFEVTPNKTTEAYEARWIQFRCIANGHPKPDIRWMHNNDPIPSNPSKNGIGSLVLGPLRTEQAGFYSCVAKNDAGKIEYPFDLRVKTRPRVHVYQSDEPSRPEQSTRLHCDVSGDADTVVWLKDGDVVSNSSRIAIMDNGKSLVISMTKAKDTGVYQCIASNPVGEDQAELRLVVESKPQLVTAPRNVTARAGSVVTLECRAEGEPVPTITCIVGVSPADDGMYHCVASSILGEDFSQSSKLQVEIDGGWSAWSSWTECSKTCGHGSQTRSRTCTEPAPRNGGAHCFGEPTEARTCLVSFCPVNGAWGAWTPWSACTATCGAGLSQRQRRCDNPPPSNGGKLRVTEPFLSPPPSPCCAVHGEWSNWSSWSACSRTCGIGLQTRERECSQPSPQYGGRLCPGSAKEVRTCEVNRPGSSLACPGSGGPIGPVPYTEWSEWTEWSDCEPDCLFTGPRSELGGWKRRTRICQLRETMQGVEQPRVGQQAHGCPGPAEDIQQCNLKPGSPECIDTGDRPKSGIVTGIIRGHLNKLDIGLIPINASWTATNEGTPVHFRFDLNDVLAENQACISALTELYTPILWYGAQEMNGASNGQKVVGPDGAWTWDTVGQFADGSTVQINHRVSYDVDLNSHPSTTRLRVDIYMTGSCPLSLTDASVVSGDTALRVHEFRENIVQLNPRRGELHGHSSRTFGLRKPGNVRYELEPYAWNSFIQSGRGRRQRYLNQELTVNQITVDADRTSRSLHLQVQARISKPIGGEVCPAGFELQSARYSGPGSTLEAMRDYCQDVDECSSRSLNKCDHVCENTVPHYTCACHSGYRLAADGHSCVDIDECANNGVSPCPVDQRCVNTPGSYECRRTCGPGLREDPSGDSCIDIDECNTKPDVCGEHQCTNTYGSYYCTCLAGYNRIGEQCEGEFTRGALTNAATQTVECVDVDECAVGSFQCPRGSRCVNEPGAYSCRCPNGSPAGGRGCDERKETLCKEGFQWDRELGCVGKFFHIFPTHTVSENPTELQEGRNLKPATVILSNLQFKAKNPMKYKREDVECDIDECKTLEQPCAADELCMNFHGNYTCIRKHCPQDYAFDQKSRSCRVRCTDSILPCPQGSQYADTVEYMIVSLPPPTHGRVTGSRVKLRVVDWNQVQQSNCRYRLLEKAPNTPVEHHSKDGVIYLTPIWNRPGAWNTGSRASAKQKALMTAQVANNPIISDNVVGQLYYLFFRVSCYKYPLRGDEGNSWEEPNVQTVGSSHNQNPLVFQHSFYVYISIAKHPF
ncbi:Hemicentin-1, partial [Fasciola gigantica]